VEKTGDDMHVNTSDQLVVPPTNDLERRSLPVEPASVDGCIKHVHCDGSRSHVPHWSFYENWKGGFSITWCSERRCIYNHVANEKLHENGMEHLCR
jgi:hypothetical protein